MQHNRGLSANSYDCVGVKGHQNKW